MRRKSIKNYNSVRRSSKIEISKKDQIKIQIPKFSFKTIHKTIMNNLLKYKSNVNDLFIGLTNSIINSNTHSKNHLKYIEILYNVDGNEFLKDFYPIKEAIEKIEKQTTFYYYIFKIYPNYYSLDETLTEIMMNNLLLKQKIIDKKFEADQEKVLEILPTYNIEITNIISFSSSLDEKKIENENSTFNPIFQKSNKENLNDSLNSIEILINNISICEKQDLNDSLELNRKTSRKSSIKKSTRRKTSVLEERKKSTLDLIGDDVIIEENYQVTSGFNKVLILSPLKKNILKNDILKKNKINEDDENNKNEFKKFTRIKDFRKKLNNNKNNNNTEELVEAYYKYKVNETSINSTNYSNVALLSLPEIKTLSNQTSNKGFYIKNKLIKKKKEKNKDILLSKINNETFKLISNNINNKKERIKIFNFKNNKMNIMKDMKKKTFSIPCLLIE